MVNRVHMLSHELWKKVLITIATVGAYTLQSTVCLYSVFVSLQELTSETQQQL